jgi:serine protease Do
MRLPAQLDTQQPKPPPASQTASGAPALPGGAGSEQSQAFGLKLANGLSEIFHDAASRVLPAVVTIRTLSKEQGDSSDPLRRFFGDDSEQVRESLGSGVIIDASGIVLTNYHVVREKGQTRVQLHDGREFEIAATRFDQLTDLAVLQLKNATGLPYARLGDSDALRVGDWVLAVGNPFGLEATVTAGIISAKGRGLAASPREEFLQTDAPINPGNSGGPLVNLRGDVVGINTAISSTTGGYQGIGFTIPINLAKSVSRELIENGKVRWAYLGVGVRKLTPDIAKRLGIDDTSGLIVLEVRRRSPAGQAGVRPGDVITRFDDKQLSDPHELQSAIGNSPIGSQHRLTIRRNGRSQTLQVTIEEQPPQRVPERRTSGPDALGNTEPQNVVR